MFLFTKLADTVKRLYCNKISDKKSNIKENNLFENNFYLGSVFSVLRRSTTKWILAIEHAR